MTTASADGTEAVVRRYFAIVADLASTTEELESVIAPDAVFREMPNPISPRGAVRDVEATLAGFRAGKERLASQKIEIEQIHVVDDLAVVRARWEGVTGATRLVAHMAGFVRVRDGRVASHDTYDCYEPFAL
jgi:ketosteroid isomerase-like protein